MFYPIQTKPPIVATTATMTSSPTTWVVATPAPSARWPRAPMSPEEGPSLRSISHPRKHRARTIFSVRHLFSLIYTYITYPHEMGTGISMRCTHSIIFGCTYPLQRTTWCNWLRSTRTSSGCGWRTRRHRAFWASQRPLRERPRRSGSRS